jgi:hypothetical protein
MAKEVVITKLAIEDYDIVVDYLTRKWGINVANNFMDRFDEIVLLISKNTSIYPFRRSDKKDAKMPAYEAQHVIF